MKVYEVVFDPHALEEAVGAAEYIARHSPKSAAKWYAGLEAAIASLGKVLNRCSLARESDSLGTDIRQYIDHSHRIIFRIEEDKSIVRILHVRHMARESLRGE